MSPSDVLVAAFKRGRAFDPAYPNLHNLDLARVQSMTGDEPDAKELVRSLQQSDANYDSLVWAFHQRFPNFDGEIGPATTGLVSLPRCPIPDFAPPPGATFDTGDAELNRAVESQQRFAEATGSGSWPASGCDTERQGVHSIRVRIDPARMPSTIQGYHKQALEAVTAAYADIGLAVRYILAADGDCEIAKLFQSLAGSVIGWNEFPSANTCNQTISGRLDTGYAPSNWQLWAGLEQHETGHGVGLQHTRGGVMNPSILLLPISWRNDPSFSTLARYFGGQPIATPTPTPQPVPVPGTPPYAEFTVPAGTYQIIRKGTNPPVIEV